jgi:hypothetical protein
MMLDCNLVAVSPSTVYGVPKAAGLLRDRSLAQIQRLCAAIGAHEHWHIDFLVHQHRMDLLLSVQRAGWLLALHCLLGYPHLHGGSRRGDRPATGPRGSPQARPQIISDRGSQLVTPDFKEFIRLWHTSHAVTPVTAEQRQKERSIAGSKSRRPSGPRRRFAWRMLCG